MNGVALVTGGARGQGAAAARAFVRDGWRVVVGDVLDEPGEAVAAELGDAARYVHLDVTDEAGWAAAVELAESRLRPADGARQQRRDHPLDPAAGRDARGVHAACST